MSGTALTSSSPPMALPNMATKRSWQDVAPLIRRDWRGLSTDTIKNSVSLPLDRSTVFQVTRPRSVPSNASSSEIVGQISDRLTQCRWISFTSLAPYLSLSCVSVARTGSDLKSSRTVRVVPWLFWNVFDLALKTTAPLCQPHPSDQSRSFARSDINRSYSPRSLCGVRSTGPAVCSQSRRPPVC